MIQPPLLFHLSYDIDLSMWICSKVRRHDPPYQRAHSCVVWFGSCWVFIEFHMITSHIDIALCERCSSQQRLRGWSGEALWR